MAPEIPGYDDLVPIGQGGFAVVYRGHDARFDRSVAIKVLSGPFDAAARRRFTRELRAMGALSRHPHCVAVYDTGFTPEDAPYLVMEEMTGGSLGQRLDDGPVPWREAVDIGRKLSGALQAAHDAGVLHRDIKPENVLFSAYGEPKLADFGIARVEGDTLTSGVIFATPAHTAPELFEHGVASRASDVYSLGSTLFAAMAGKAPFVRRGDEPAIAMLMRAAQEPIPDLGPYGVPPAICQLVEEAMAKAPDRRPTASELGDRLMAAAESATGEATASARAVADTMPIAAVDAERFPASEEPSPPPPVIPASSAQSPPAAAPRPREPRARRPVPDRRRGKRVGALVAVIALVLAALAVAAIAAQDDETGDSPRARDATTAPTTATTAPASATTEPATDAVGSSPQLATQPIEVGEAPTGLTLADGSLWVGTFGDGTVSRIDVASNEVEATIPLGGRISELATSESGVWVTNYSDGTASRIDPDTNEVVATAQVGSEPIGVAGQETDVWVASFRDGTVSRVGPQGDVVARFDLGGNPVGVATGDGAVWVTNQADGTVTRIDPQTEELTPVGIGGAPLGVAVGEGAVWVTNAGDNTVSRIDPATNAVSATIPVGERPFRVAVGGGAVWVTNRGDGTVSRIDPSTNSVTAVVDAVGAGPSRVTVGNGTVWVSDEDGTSVYRIDPAR